MPQYRGIDGVEVSSEPYDEPMYLTIMDILHEAFADHHPPVKIAIRVVFLRDQQGGYRMLQVWIYDAETDEVITPEINRLNQALKVLRQGMVPFHLIETHGQDDQYQIYWARDLTPFAPVVRPPKPKTRELTARDKAWLERMNRAGQND